MADLDELKIPKAMRAVSEAVIVLTDEVCADLLDEEYASLARTVVAKLARKRPSPIQSGRASTWAGAVVYALGQVNFLFDSSTKPYATADDLSEAFGVAKSTLGAKAKQVRDLTKMDYARLTWLSALAVLSAGFVCSLVWIPPAREYRTQGPASLSYLEKFHYPTSNTSSKFPSLPFLYMAQKKA